MVYSKTSYNVGDIIKVSGNGPASEKGAIIFMGENFLTYRGPYYNKTLSSFDISSGKVTITVTDHYDDINEAIEEVNQIDTQESFTSGWITPSIYAEAPTTDDESEDEE
ncbi:MAG: hypothetical protein IJE46_00095 [Clostridia bacterium]|nr:hypothetical protein [Clostridia bacterium]